MRRTSTMLTAGAAVCRSLPAELGRRPLHHRTPRRADGHLCLTVLADQLVQILRTRLGAPGEHASWATLRRILAGPQRAPATCPQPDGCTLPGRTVPQAAPEQRALSAVLGGDPQPGRVRQTIICPVPAPVGAYG